MSARTGSTRPPMTTREGVTWIALACLAPLLIGLLAQYGPALWAWLLTDAAMHAVFGFALGVTVTTGALVFVVAVTPRGIP